jgi:UDP-N-acetylmuramoyl-tripeptide--D-alanyl-D-alanine ligase
MIIEMGANHPGEIKALCNIARPDYGIITNVGTAHLEGFGSLEGVLKTKSELYEYLGSVNGIAMYNDKDAMLAKKIFKMVNRAVPFSDPTGLELIVKSLPSPLHLKISATYQNRVYDIQTNLFGDFNLENVRAAIAVGLFFEVKMTDIADAVENYTPENNRSEIRHTKYNTIICDSYNANPTSMALAIQSVKELNAEKKVFILGDMLELGEKSEEEHLKILQTLGSDNPEVMLVGPEFEKVSYNFPFKSFSDINSLEDYLKREPVRESTILIKGSRGMALERDLLSSIVDLNYY